MSAVARFVRGRHRTVARTLRETFGVGLSDLGDGLSWGEAKLLIEAASEDPTTALGAELADWAYRASTLQLLELAAAVRDPKAMRELLPWSRALKKNTATPDEIATAQAELEVGIVFSAG